jgi:hypothetical protein
MAGPRRVWLKASTAAALALVAASGCGRTSAAAAPPPPSAAPPPAPQAIVADAASPEGRRPDSTKPDGGAVQLALLQRMPADVLEHIARGGRPDASGAVGHNRGAWMGAQYQRSAALYLMSAVARGDRAGAEDAWRAIDLAFAHQDETGGFGSRNESGTPSAPKDLYSDAAFWLAQLDQALLVTRASSLSSVFQDRINSLRPRVIRAATFLAQGESLLIPRDGRATNRYFIDGLAFELSSLVAGSDETGWVATGARFIDRALGQQHPEGYFDEAGGGDSSYNAVSILMLQIHDLYFPDGRSAEALQRAMVWELSRIEPSGEISTSGNSRTGLGQERYFGAAKDVNYPEVTLALLYVGARRHDDAIIGNARRVFDFRLTQ